MVYESASGSTPLDVYKRQVYASGTEDPQNGTSMSNTEEEKDSLFSLFSRSQRDPYTGKNYTHNSRFNSKEIKHCLLYTSNMCP